jgi:hypothetical protein
VTDVPVYVGHQHYSAPVVIPPLTSDYGDPEFRLQVWQTSDEWLDVGTAHLTLTVHRPDVLSIEAYDVGDDQVCQLAERPTEAADLLDRLAYERREGGVPDEH